MTGEFPHKGPVTRKMFPFDDVIMWWFTLIPFASWLLLPTVPLNYALSCSENGLVPQERIKTIFSQNKPIFKQKMSWKMVSAKYWPFVGTGATYTISLETCTWIGCALFCCGHNIIDSWHTFYWLGLEWDSTHWSLGDVDKEIKKQFFTSFSDLSLGYPMNVTGLYWLQVNIVSGNGLCRQTKAIKWVDIDPVLCRQMASPGHNVLINWWR